MRRFSRYSRGTGERSEEVGGGLKGRFEVPPFALAAGPARPLLGPRRQGNPEAHRQRLDRGREVVARGQHVELDGVAAGAAAEAVEETLDGIDAERRGLLLVDRAEAAEAPAGLAQPGVLGGHGDDVGGVAHRLHELRGEMDVAQRHGAAQERSVTTVAPLPPSLGAPERTAATPAWPRRWSRTAWRSRPVPWPCTTRTSLRCDRIAWSM